MSSGGQQPVTQQTTQTKDPWSGAVPALSQVQGAASGLYNANIGYQPYTGQTQANFDPYQMTGMLHGLEIAQSEPYGSAALQSARTFGQNQIENAGLSPELKSLYQMAQGNENPYLQNMINTSNRQISDKIGSSMSGAGRYGSGQHTDVAARAMAEAADPLLAQDYARRQQQQQDILTGGLQRAGTWATVMPTLDAARYANSAMMQGIGGDFQAHQQALINDQIKQYNASQARDWEQLARYNAIAGGAGGLGGTQITSSPLQQPSSIQKLLGGAAAGAGIGGSFGGPAGAGVGALGGGLLGML